MKRYDRIEPGAPVLNLDGDLCVVTGPTAARERGRGDGWWVSILPGETSRLVGRKADITRRWYDEENLTLLVPVQKPGPKKEDPTDDTNEESPSFQRVVHRGLHGMQEPMTGQSAAPYIDPGKEKAVNDAAEKLGFKPQDRGVHRAQGFLPRLAQMHEALTGAPAEPETGECPPPSEQPGRLSDEDLQVAIDSAISALRPPVMGAGLPETVRNRLDAHLDHLLSVQQLRAYGEDE